MLRTKVSTCLSQGTGVRRVWVSVVITEVFGNVVSRQLSHNVWDVSVRAEVLQPFVGTTLWRITNTAVATSTTATALKATVEGALEDQQASCIYVPCHRRISYVLISRVSTGSSLISRRCTALYLRSLRSECLDDVTQSQPFNVCVGGKKRY